MYFLLRITYFFIIGLVMLGHGIIIPLFTNYISHNHGDPIIIGILVASFSLGSFISAPFIGNFLNDNSNKKILQLSFFIYICSLIITLSITNFFLLIVIRFISGVLMSTIFSVIEISIAKSPKDENEKSIDYFIVSVSNAFGITIGPFIGILLLTRWNLLVLQVIFILMIVILLLIQYIFRNNSIFSLNFKNISDNYIKPKNIFQQNSFNFKDKKIIIYLLLAFSIFGFIVSSFESFGLSYIILKYNFSIIPSNFSIYLPYIIEIIMLIILSSIYLFIINPIIINSIGSFKLIIVSALFSALSLIFLIFTTSIYISIFEIVILIVSLAIYSNSIILSISNKSFNPGLTLGLKTSTMALGATIGPIISSIFFTISPNLFPFLLIVILLIIALYGFCFKN